MKRFWRVASIILGAIATGYFLVFAYHTARAGDLRALHSSPLLSGVLAVAVAYAAVIPVTSWAWGRLLRGVGVRFPLLRLNMILGLTQIAKYIPGNVTQYFGRAALSIANGMPKGTVFVTLTVETVLASVAALSVGAIGIGVYILEGGKGTVAQPEVLILVALAVPLLICGLPWVMRLVQGLVRKVRGTELQNDWVTLPGRYVLCVAFVTYSLNYLVIGLCLYAVAIATTHAAAQIAALCVGVFALGWLVGAAVPGAPAGLGVREGAMVAFLAPALGNENALQIVIGLRIGSTLGDLLGFAWGGTLYILDPRRMKSRLPTNVRTDRSQ